MTNYEINKIGYASLPAMPEEAIQKARNNIIRNFLFSHMNEYYMLLNNDARYYTIFTYEDQVDIEKMCDEILSIAKDLGDIKEICLDNSGEAIEFWITYNNECQMFLLFDYTKGVVKV